MKKAKELFDSYAERVENDEGSIVSLAACLAAIRAAVAGEYRHGTPAGSRCDIKTSGAYVKTYKPE